MTHDRDAQIAQILGGQRRQDLGINLVVTKRLRVALQSQVSQPNCDVQDTRPAPMKVQSSTAEDWRDKPGAQRATPIR
ncbi:MAG TPA: hypothetical protein VLE23_01015, partial [Geminicoccaceae bacterium]|nr:hypothetical protein [Geminicoccaceae bacterium]